MLKVKSVAIERQETLIVQTGELSVSSGEHVAVLGPNGAGKSSLL
jgi:ABC-type cobalamin/Fe3+-siderophores transport system ATPase subunit